VTSALHDMLGAPGTLPTANIEAAVDDFLRMARDPRYRLAIVASARHLMKDRATGRNGFWTRLAELEVPSYWIWGRNDRLVTHRYADRVREAVPTAKVEVWDGVGHVPQFEDPKRTHSKIRRFLDGIESTR